MEAVFLKNIKSRKPVLDCESFKQYPPDQIDQQWRLLTEAVRRNILTQSGVRAIAIGYISSPVHESLPKNFLDRLSSDTKIAKLRDRYKGQIRDYLELESVPDDQITPDIKHARSITNPKEIIHRLQILYGINTPEYYQHLQEAIESGKFLHGITTQERWMITQRYSFARDVKLLALQAETASLGENIEINNCGEVILPSWTIIKINVDNVGKWHELLNPQNWHKRRQIKDRVYEIQVWSSKYILKEKKTARHIDTKKHGHEPGLSSLEEFLTARHFHENGSEEQDSIKVSWEKPIASVTFPDGFQFTVFEYNDDLLDEDAIIQALSQEIMKYREQFEVEFEFIKRISIKYRDDPKVLIFNSGSKKSKLSTITRWLRFQKKIPELSFEEFALIKALRIKRWAIYKKTEIITKNGYENHDRDGYLFKINIQNNRPQLEIFGFDFEYFSKISAQESERRVKSYKDNEKDYESTYGIGFLNWSDGNSVTPIQQATYFAFLEAEGIL